MFAWRDPGFPSFGPPHAKRHETLGYANHYAESSSFCARDADEGFRIRIAIGPIPALHPDSAGAPSTLVPVSAPDGVYAEPGEDRDGIGKRYDRMTVPIVSLRCGIILAGPSTCREQIVVEAARERDAYFEARKTSRRALRRGRRGRSRRRSSAWRRGRARGASLPPPDDIVLRDVPRRCISPSA